MSRILSNRRCFEQAPRRGLTLIELVVVLTILIALAGILIPLLPSMLSRSHHSSVATNLGECSRQIQVYQQLYTGYPDQWDALTDGKTDVIDYMAGGAGAPDGTGTKDKQVGGQITSGTLEPGEINALNAAGITHLHLMKQKFTDVTVTGSPTFNPYITNPADQGASVSSITTFALLSPTLANQLLGAKLTGKYVLLGLGQRNTMIGRTMAESPLVFGDNPNLNPTLAYVRYVAVFQVSDSASGSSLSTAVFAGMLEPDDSGFHSVNNELQSWYDLGKGNN